MEYAVAEWRNKYRLASENPAKEEVIARLLEQYKGKQLLIIGQYLHQLRQLKKRFNIPLITGQTPNSEREDIYNQFRRGEIKQLILSKVGNFAIDLPDANVLIQVSGTFGSRAGRSPAAGADSQAQGEWRPGAFLYAGNSRYARAGFRASSAAFLDGARLQL